MEEKDPTSHLMCSLSKQFFFNTSWCSVLKLWSIYHQIDHKTGYAWGRGYLVIDRLWPRSGSFHAVTNLSLYVFCCRLRPLHGGCPWVRPLSGFVSLRWSWCSHVPCVLIQKPWHLRSAPGWCQRHPVSLWFVPSALIVHACLHT